jgi:hypothetical protein
VYILKTVVFHAEAKMQKTWSYKTYEINEGLKPGSSTFRYFFVVSDSGEKKCNYCVWIVDDALSRFDTSKGYNEIVSSQTETWHRFSTEHR